MLVVLTLLALAAGFVGINAVRALREQRFQNEAAAVRDTLQLAQELMLVTDIGAVVLFEGEEEGIRCRIKTDELLTEEWKRAVERDLFLTAVRVVEFDGEEEKKEGELKLHFLSGGLLMSEGVLRLSTARGGEDAGGLDRYILLPGYPAPLALSKQKPEKEDKADDERLTQEMLQQIEA